MRIVGGKHKGRVLGSPKGLGTRPTSDRARQAVFNILEHAAWLKGPAIEEAQVLDVFAGTGAMGLEALSRGAKHAVFIDSERPAAQVCQDNIDAFGETENALLMTFDATRAIPRHPYLAPRTLVFLDPPYKKGLGALALQSLVENDWLEEGAVIVFEMAKKNPEETPPGFTLLDERAYGVALVRFLKWT